MIDAGFRLQSSRTARITNIRIVRLGLELLALSQKVLGYLHDLHERDASFPYGHEQRELLSRESYDRPTTLHDRPTG